MLLLLAMNTPTQKETKLKHKKEIISTYKKPDAFSEVLAQRADAYFEEMGISRYDGGSVVFVNLAIALLFYFIPYLLLLTGMLPNLWWVILLGIIQSNGFVMIGTNMHHGSHGSFHQNKHINTFVKKLVWIIGAADDIWFVQHVTLHHTHTNIHRVDGDLHSGEGSIYFSKFAKTSWINRYQHIYGMVLYGLSFLSRILIADFKQLHMYCEKGYMNTRKKSYHRQLLQLIIFKLIFFSVILLLPVLMGVPFLHSLVLWLSCVIVAGFKLTPIFQLAHINEWAPQHLDEASGKDTFVRHQMKSSVDFYWGKNQTIDWLATMYWGGLNYQCIHHIWPRTSYVHYPALAIILSEVCEMKQFKDETYHRLPYWQVLSSHVRILKKIGFKMGSELMDG
ncbi:MAG: fatty acid desaturase [Bacteroidota bacterium]